MTAANQYDPLYVAFLAYFNRERDYFECHEVMEQLWLEEGRDPLYQGLLQVAVGLYHHRNGNIDGGVKLLTAAIHKLEGRHEPIVLGIELGKLLSEAKEHLMKLEHHVDRPFAFRDIDIEIVDLSLQEAVDAFTPGDEGEHEE
jgi:predicted metal-dependent hydrolase